VHGAINLLGLFKRLRLIVRCILDLTGSAWRLEFHPLPADGLHQRCPDISLARAALGWAPSVSLRNGFRAGNAQARWCASSRRSTTTLRIRAWQRRWP
jgi:nucleoside-diphosphate-sugar epimerase